MVLLVVATFASGIRPCSKLRLLFPRYLTANLMVCLRVPTQRSSLTLGQITYVHARSGHLEFKQRDRDLIAAEMQMIQVSLWMFVAFPIRSVGISELVPQYVRKSPRISISIFITLTLTVVDHVRIPLFYADTLYILLSYLDIVCRDF